MSYPYSNQLAKDLGGNELLLMTRSLSIENMKFQNCRNSQDCRSDIFGKVLPHAKNKSIDCPHSYYSLD
jgi:hypothetical protein